MTILDATTEARIHERIATTIVARTTQVHAAVELLDSGATVPFIARYRKEATGGLTDTQLRDLEVALAYGRALEERRGVILESIRSQGKLTEELEAAICEADTKQRLEDLYLPYKPKRRTRAQIAREAGLEPLANLLWTTPETDPEQAASGFVNAEKGVATAEDALSGARDILAENIAQDADLLAEVREFLWKKGLLTSSVVEGKKTETEAATFRDYFEFSEPIASVPSHRALAVFRGQTLGFLKVSLTLTPEEEELAIHPCQQLIAEHYHWKNSHRPADAWLSGVFRWAWKVKCSLQLENDLFARLRQAAEEAAIAIFGTNLRDLLMAAPAGHKAVIGLDPGIRTGVKVAVISETSAVLETTVIFPHEPKRDWEGSIATLNRLAKTHHATLVAIGNGTASRETDKLVCDLMAQHPELGLAKAVVSEAGASVYSASEAAAEELPDMDVSYRGAVSIARRLQDPLAELVKIDPKAIGVGQYQHDVNQADLAQKLDSVVEDCVNAVGVDLNTASATLLCHVAGLNRLQAKRIVAFREANGAFANRARLLDVPRFGQKAFEQCAGFLRIPKGENPLDASGVHPEAYPVVERIVRASGLALPNLMGNKTALSALKATDFVDERFGLPTVLDILKELEKPGRDPRPEFRTAKFQESVRELSDLKPGMVLEGVVSNVAAFGAFVDIGVHQDGLVHVSEMADRFVRDPREVVSVGQIVEVRVLDVDLERHRISLSLRKSSGKTASAPREHRKMPPKKPAATSAFAQALQGAWTRR